MRILISFFILNIIFVSCSNEKENQGFDNDFESMGNWAELPNVVKGNSKSGHFSTVTDSSIEFSQTARIKVSDLTIKNPHTVKVYAWVMTRDLNAKGRLVVTLDSLGKNLAWDGTNVRPLIKEPGKWYEVTSQIELPSNINPESHIMVYGWNNGNGKIYWDDFKIRVK